MLIFGGFFSVVIDLKMAREKHSESSQSTTTVGECTASTLVCNAVIRKGSHTLTHAHTLRLHITTLID